MPNANTPLVDFSLYERSHGRLPRGAYACWMFRRVDGPPDAVGTVESYTGTIAYARAQLPKGRWMLLP